METLERKTVKRKINFSTEKEVEFSIPFFQKAGSHYFKIISEEEAICVHNPEGWNTPSVGVVGISTAFCLDNIKEISESEFLQEKEAALQRINAL